jgi:hypothetical protein
MKQHLQKIAWHLRERRNMYVHAGGYLPFRSFVEGYFTAIGDVYAVNLHHDFHEWFSAKVNHSFSISAMDYIYNELARKQDDLAERIFFNYLDQVANELP